MNPQTTDTHPDTAADEQTQTMELFGERLDRATPCAEKTTSATGPATKKGTRKATEQIERAVTSAADRARDKTRR